VLPVKEEERAIPDQASAKGRPVLIAHERRAGDARPVVEPVVGREGSVAVVLVKRTVELVRPALGNQRPLAAGGTALIGAEPRDRRTELLHGIERYGQN